MLSQTVYIVNWEALKVSTAHVASPAANAATNCHDTEAGAIAELQSKCPHTTKLGIRSTGGITCADCKKPLNAEAGAKVPDPQVLQDNAMAAYKHHYNQAQTLVGQYVRVTGEYRDQCYGSSKPSLKGQIRRIKTANFTNGRLTILLNGCSVYMGIEKFQLIDPLTEEISLGDRAKAAHGYDVEIGVGGGIGADSYKTRIINVDAQNRDHAGRLAEQAGFEVRSVNMTS